MTDTITLTSEEAADILLLLSGAAQDIAARNDDGTLYILKRANGLVELLISKLGAAEAKKCKECGGKGYVLEFDCRSCHGTGKEER